MDSMSIWAGWVLQMSHAYGIGKLFYCPTTWYFTCAHIHSSVYRPRLWRFSMWNVHEFGHQSRHAIFVSMTSSQVTFCYLKRRMDKNIKIFLLNCCLCHLPIEETFHPELAFVCEGLPCFVCGEKKHVAIMLLCDTYQQDWYTTYLTLPLILLPSNGWICPQF